LHVFDGMKPPSRRARIWVRHESNPLAGIVRLMLHAEGFDLVDSASAADVRVLDTPKDIRITNTNGDSVTLEKPVDAGVLRTTIAVMGRSATTRHLVSAP